MRLKKDYKVTIFFSLGICALLWKYRSTIPDYKHYIVWSFDIYIDDIEAVFPAK